MTSGRINEIFSSIQGEGPWAGERHIFVRFRGCDIHCRFCDTSSAAREDGEGGLCRIQKSVDSSGHEVVPETMTESRLTEFCKRLVIPGPSRPTISLTGGEPLLQRDFLVSWLPSIRSGFRVYLETNGLQYEAMEALRELVDVVSMDFKLPSATGLQPFWEEHRKFLEAAQGTARYVKVVVTRDTERDDVLRAAAITARHDGAIPFVIQPAGGPLAPPPAFLVALQNAALGIAADVRVIPQVHKMLSVP